MNEATGKMPEPTRIPRKHGWAAGSALGAIIATTIALAAFVVIGLISWAAVRGLQGVGICGTLAAAAGAALWGPGSRRARVFGGAIGGVVAGYFAVASSNWSRRGQCNGRSMGAPTQPSLPFLHRPSWRASSVFSNQAARDEFREVTQGIFGTRGQFSSFFSVVIGTSDRTL
jgi:hypothetical protein